MTFVYSISIAQIHWDLRKSTQSICQKPLVRGFALFLPLCLTINPDRDILVESTKLALKISKTEPLASLIVARHDPAPDVVSDADIIAYVKANAKTLHHPVGASDKYILVVIEVSNELYLKVRPRQFPRSLEVL